MSGVSISPNNDSYQFLTAVITTAATGAYTPIAGVTGQYTRVYKIFISAAGTTTVTFQDGSTALSGAVSLVAGQPLVLPNDGNPWFTTSKGAGFTLTNGQGIQISGTVYYTQTPFL